MGNSLHSIAGLKAEKSVLKSVFLSSREGDDQANIKVDIKNYDGVLTRMEEAHGVDHILDMVRKRLGQAKTQKAVCEYLDIPEITGIFITYHSTISESFEHYMNILYMPKTIRRVN